MINGGQYIFSYNEFVEQIGIFNISDTHINIKLLREAPIIDPSDAMSTVLLEVAHVEFTDEVIVISNTDSSNIIIRHRLYIVHESFFVSRAIPYRQVIAFVYAISIQLDVFIPYNYDAPGYDYINEEHSFLCARVYGFCEVSRKQKI